MGQRFSPEKNIAFQVLQIPEPERPLFSDLVEELDQALRSAACSLCRPEFIQRMNAVAECSGKLHKQLRKIGGAPWRYRTPHSLKPSRWPKE